MLALGLSTFRFRPQTGDVSAVSAVWMWEDGIGLQWETGINMLTE